MFEKWKKKEKKNEKITYENLSMPEYHTGKCHHETQKQAEEERVNENLAIPEIHIKKKHKCNS